MRPISNKLFTVFRRLDGAQFFAYLSATAAAPTKDQMPYRILVVKSRGIVQPGTVVQAPGGDKLLVLEYSNDHNWSEAYRAAYASKAMLWQRRVVETDPVSLVKRMLGLQEMGTLYAYVDKPEYIAFEGSGDTKYRILTGEDVEPGDLIDGKTVKRVYQIMGVKAVEIE
jgi:hypothetical protein